ncbi:MAG: hypothetical protein HY717_18070 [Planctomycetes bacterium]|nr:hypothetical protein [Planctomycetota bacterium]
MLGLTVVGVCPAYGSEFYPWIDQAALFALIGSVILAILTTAVIAVTARRRMLWLLLPIFAGLWFAVLFFGLSWFLSSR